VKVIIQGIDYGLTMDIENKNYTAEQQLWAEMLRQAMKDALHPGQYFHRDRRWFRRKATKVGSFLWVLSVLNLEGAKEQIQEVVFGKSEFAEHCRYWLCRDRGGHRNRLMSRKADVRYRHVMRAA
jgi:hypothetical protein